MDETGKKKLTKHLWFLVVVVVASGLASIPIGCSVINRLSSTAWPFVVLILGFWIGLVVLGSIISHILRRLWMEE